MSDTPPKVPGSRRSGQQFLFFQTRTQPGDGPCPERVGSGTAPCTAPADLLVIYPELLGAEALIGAAAHCVGACSRFAVLAICLDPPTAKTDGACTTALATALESLCRPCKGIWGWMESGLFGCWLPEADQPTCQVAAEAVAAALAAAGATATIGMALYPTLDFAREGIWANARKALDHAAFFGADSRVFFDAVSLNISGDRLFEAGDLDGAVAEFQKALELDPAETNVLNSLGVCWSHLGQPEKALACFEKVRQIDPAEAMAWYNIGLVKVMGGQDKALALADFEQADRLAADVFEIKLQIGTLCLGAKDLARARAFLESAVALKPASALAQRLLGQCLEQSGLALEAVAALRKAVKANPNDAEALSLLGALLGELGENAEIALAFCRHSVELAPEVAEFRHRLARLYEKIGQMQQAVLEMERAKALAQQPVVAADTEAVK